MQVFASKPSRPNKLLKSVCVLHDDDDIAVLVKPENVYTHGRGPRRGRNSLTHVVTQLVARTRARDPLTRPSPAHRLDALTGGIVVFVKTLAAAQAMRIAFDTSGAVAKRCAAHLDLHYLSFLRKRRGFRSTRARSPSGARPLQCGDV
jgi:23S rRNA-/tRNA-specific pseudouridylate synthase